MPIEPHNLDAEENVIGSLLIDGTLIQGLSLEPGDFYHEANQLLFGGCKSLAERGVSINMITLAQELNEHGKLDTVGGAAFLSHLVSTCVTPFDCGYYAEIVQRLAASRGMIAAAGKIAELGYSQSADMASTLNQADELLLSLRKRGIPAQVITPEERAKVMTERYNKLRETEQGMATPTGLTDLDTAIGGGLYAGEMVILAARPGMGKTNFIMDIANHVGSSLPVLVCSAEMTVAGLTDREVAGTLGISTNSVRRGGYDADTWVKILGKGLSGVLKRKVYFYHQSPMTTAGIMQAATEVKLRHGLSLVIVDYLGLLDDDFGKSQYERVGYVSRKLKQITMTLDIPMLVAHQLNRALELREDKRPQLYDLRDSGKVEEDADLVLFLFRESYYQETTDSVTEILIAKQRQGEGHRVVKVSYDREHQRYCDLAHH